MARALQSASGMPGMPNVEVAYSAAMLELTCLERSNEELSELHRQTREVDRALGELCDGLEAGDPRTAWYARGAFLATVALAQMLEDIDLEDERNVRARSTLELTRTMVRDLLDALGPYVAPADREMRAVLLSGPPLERSLQQLFDAENGKGLER